MKKNILKSLLGLICFLGITILTIPILFINIDELKQIAIKIFKCKENMYQYLQFFGTFLGIIITVITTYIITALQIINEKEIDIQIEYKKKSIKILLDIREYIEKLENFIILINKFYYSDMGIISIPKGTKTITLKEEFIELKNNYDTTYSKLIKSYEENTLLIKDMTCDMNSIKKYKRDINQFISIISLYFNDDFFTDKNKINNEQSKFKDLPLKLSEYIGEIDIIIDELKKVL